MTMTITKDAAAQALGEVEAARGRMVEARSYANASPFLIIWGAVWMFADLAIQFAPPSLANYAWPAGILVGTVASIAASFTLPRRADGAKGWRAFGLWGVIAGFFVALFLVIPVTSGVEIHSIFGIVFGFLYMGFGLWMGWRVIALGAALVALTLIGFYEVRAWYGLYMGLVSGGALILGGLWLRKI
ncbi:MAG TPA: hypothetical protein VGG29_06835 [Caulobacteraceae bacterium]|jgi:hypothetical protein